MEKEEKFNIKLNFYGDKVEIYINSDYNSFINKICNVLKISPERAKKIVLSYNDEDGDSILLSNMEDFSIFIEQVKQKVVQELIIEVNDNLEDSDLDHKNSMKQSNININFNSSFNNITNRCRDNTCLETKDEYFRRLLKYLKNKYIVEGISDQKLIEALHNSKGDIDKAFDYLLNN